MACQNREKRRNSSLFFLHAKVNRMMQSLSYTLFYINNNNYTRLVETPLFREWLMTCNCGAKRRSQQVSLHAARFSRRLLTPQFHKNVFQMQLFEEMIEAPID